MADDKVDPSIVKNGLSKPKTHNKIADILAIIFAAALIAAVVNSVKPGVGQALFPCLMLGFIALYLWKPMPPRPPKSKK